jgi:hypothetical protein
MKNVNDECFLFGCVLPILISSHSMITSISLTGRSLSTQITNAQFNNVDPLAPGSYTSSAGINLNGDIYLDNSDSNSTNVWSFTVGSLTATTSCNVSFEYPDSEGTVTWYVTGAINLGAESVMIGDMISTNGVITLGANAESDDLTAEKAAILLGAYARSGDLTSGAAITLGAGAECGNVNAVEAVTLGAGAIVDGLLEAGAAINMGAGCNVKGQSKAGAAITVGAGSFTCALCAGAAITLGAGTHMNVANHCDLNCNVEASVCANIVTEDAYECPPI